MTLKLSDQVVSSDSMTIAVGFEQFGELDRLKLLQRVKPRPGPGEVVIQVVSATINPTDLLMISGAQATKMVGLRPPYIAGMELAGRVEQVGEGVTGLVLGQAVMGIVNPRRPEGGAQASYVCLPASSVVPAPDGLDLAVASTIPMNGLTAKLCLDGLNLSKNNVVLVTGALGAVGGYAIQLAKHAGLHVIADAKEGDHDLVRQLGADDIVPRGPALIDTVRQHYPQGVDGLIDAALLGESVTPLVRDGGAVTLLRGGDIPDNSRLRYLPISAIQHSHDTTSLDWLTRRVNDGTLKPRVAVRVPVSQFQQAYQLVQTGGLRGRVIIEFDKPSSREPLSTDTKA